MNTSGPGENAGGLAALGGAQAVLPGGARWASYRADALTRLLRSGLPTPRDDGFKYANLRLLERRDLRPVVNDEEISLAARPAATEHEGSERLGLPGAISVTLVNGRLGDALPPAVPGLRITRLRDVLADAAPGDLAWLAEPGNGADDRLRLLAAACIDDGLLIRVEPGTEIAIPLHLTCLATRAGSYPRVRVELGADATLTLVEEHLSRADNDTVTVAVTDIALAPGAKLTHFRLQDSSPRAIVLEEVAAGLAHGASYAHHSHGFGARLGRLDLAVDLAGAHAATDLTGLFIADAGRALHLRTRVRHIAADTRSAQNYRGVAGARGRGSYDGKVIVERGAGRADSRQVSRNLLLATDAEIDTRPQLEIYTDDVKCSHGATTGTLDQQMLFYLLSRGIDARSARGLLTYAFASDVIRHVPIDALKSLLGRRVIGLLPDAELLKEFLA